MAGRVGGRGQETPKRSVVDVDVVEKSSVDSKTGCHRGSLEKKGHNQSDPDE